MKISTSRREEFKTTTNSSVYKKLYKEHHAGCSFCRWHPNFYHFSENDVWESYYLNENKSTSNKPNWKLVSKNKKQWMKKPLKVISTYNNWKQDFYHELIW